MHWKRATLPCWGAMIPLIHLWSRRRPVRSWWWSVDWGHWQSSSVSPGWWCRAAGDDDAGTTDFPSDARRQFAATNTDSQSPAEYASQRIPRHRIPPTAHRHYIIHRLQPILHCISNPPPPHHKHFTALFPGPPRSQKRTSGLYGASGD